MNRDEFEGKWHELKGKIQEKWGKLTHDDIAKINGKWEQCLGCLQKKYGYTKEHAERELKNWQAGHQKEAPRAWGEKKSYDELAQEDTNPVYPLDSEKKSQNPNPWKSENKNQNKPKNNDQDYKDKKRKAG